MTLQRNTNNGRLLLKNAQEPDGPVDPPVDGRLVKQCCCDSPPESGWYQCEPAYCSGDFVALFKDVASPKFMVFFTGASLERWEENGYPNILYYRGPRAMSYIIGDFLTGNPDPEEEGFTTGNGWLSLGSCDGRFSAFEDSPGVGTYTNSGLLSTLPSPEFTFVDADLGFVGHVLAFAGHAGSYTPDTPRNFDPDTLRLASGMDHYNTIPQQITMTLGQLPNHSDYETCEPIEEILFDSYVIYTGFEQGQGQWPAPGSVPAIWSGPNVYVDAAFGTYPMTIDGEEILTQSRNSSVGRVIVPLERLPLYENDCASIPPRGMIYYTMSAVLHYGRAGDNPSLGCPNPRGPCVDQIQSGCPICEIVGPPCAPEGGVPGYDTCDFRLLNYGGSLVSTISEKQDPCDCLRDGFGQATPTDVPFLGTDAALRGQGPSDVVPFSIGYGDTGTQPSPWRFSTTFWTDSTFGKWTVTGAG